MANVVVCGGSVIGLSTAMMLAGDGHGVTVLEGDPGLPPDGPADAWNEWDRTGVPQFHQPHNLFARVRQVLDEELPGLNDDLVAAGCTWIDPLATLPPSLSDQTHRPTDDRFRSVTGRRPVVEATFASAAVATSGLTIRRGTRVAGLRAGAQAVAGTPHVDGVILDSGEELDADLVVDAMGRRSKLADWLADLGAAPPAMESEDAGFVYWTRFFHGSTAPVVFGPPLVPIGTISVLTLPGDNGTWSVTVYGASDDRALKGLRDPERWTRVVAACPLQAHWLDGDPITGVNTMAGILDRYRRYVVDGRPVATGVVAVGDAWACTNPSAGRGMSVGLAHAQHLRRCVGEGLDDPAALALRFDAATEAEVAPYFRNQIAADRRRFAEMTALREGAEPLAPDPMAAAVGVALAYDPEVFRAMIETVTCLGLPEEVFARPGFRERLEPFLGQAPDPAPGPDRSQLLALLA